MKLLLIFHNHLYASNYLINGRLILINKQTDEIQDIYIASSGLPGYQEVEKLSFVGRGSIPPFFLPYQVTTTPINEPNAKGIEGNFYPILPETVTFNDVERGEFGIHRDANVPGSAGCIVLTTSVGWNAFQQQMAKLADCGCKQIPLLVNYSR